MKKVISSIVLGAMVLTATPAFANNQGNDDDGDKDRVKASVNFRARLGNIFNRQERGVPADRFSIVGTVTATAAESITLTVEETVHANALVKGQSATVQVNTDTKFFARREGPVTFADIKAGDRVVASGKLSDSLYAATHVWDLGILAKKAYGKVTAKTGTSVTIQNNQTGRSQTFTVDGDTKVAINGEAKTIADINVGDAGMVKFKSLGASLWAKIVTLFR